MAEMLSYAPDLRSITGGQGEYTMEFAALRGGPRRTSRRRSSTQAASETRRGWSGGYAGRPPSLRGPTSRAVATLGGPRDRPRTSARRSVHVLRRLRAHAAARRARRDLSRRRRAAAQVCELCTARALHEGWIREGAERPSDGRAARPRPPRSLLGRLRPRASRSRPRARGRRPTTDDRAGPRADEPRGGERPRAPEPVAPAARGEPATCARSRPASSSKIARGDRALQRAQSTRARSPGSPARSGAPVAVRPAPRARAW